MFISLFFSTDFIHISDFLYSIIAETNYNFITISSQFCKDKIDFCSVRLTKLIKLTKQRYFSYVSGVHDMS